MIGIGVKRMGRTCYLMFHWREVKTGLFVYIIMFAWINRSPPFRQMRVLCKFVTVTCFLDFVLPVVTDDLLGLSERLYTVCDNS